MLEKPAKILKFAKLKLFVPSSSKVGDLGEFYLIRRLIEILGSWGNDLISGEDDAVAFPAPTDPSHVLVIHTDMLVRATDVPNQMSLYQAGHKVVVQNVSDLLVKGVIPRWAVVALGLPVNLSVEGDFGFDGLIRGLRDGCRKYGVQYLGGDLGETGDLTVSMTVGGEIDPNYILRRTNAHPGDILVTTGQWGLTGVGFDILFHRPQIYISNSKQYSRCIDAVLNPQVDNEIGPDLAIHEQAHAGADSSDGFIRTIFELCNASKTGATIEWKGIPIPDIVRSYAQEFTIPLEQLVLSTGEEFNHIFAIPPDKLDSIKRKWGSRLTQIGVLNDNPEKIELHYSKGHSKPLKEIGEGYQHFKK